MSDSELNQNKLMENTTKSLFWVGIFVFVSAINYRWGSHDWFLNLCFTVVLGYFSENLGRVFSQSKSTQI